MNKFGWCSADEKSRELQEELKNRKIVYIDLDDVTFNFTKAFTSVAEKEWTDGSEKKVPKGFFQELEPIDGAIEAITKLSQYYNVFFLSTPQWSNPDCWMEKRISVGNHFADLMFKKLILTHDKTLLKGHYLIDDRIQDGISKFEGQHIHFGTDMFPNWDIVLRYLIDETKK